MVRLMYRGASVRLSPRGAPCASLERRLTRRGGYRPRFQCSTLGGVLVPSDGALLADEARSIAGRFRKVTPETLVRVWRAWPDAEDEPLKEAASELDLDWGRVEALAYGR